MPEQKMAENTHLGKLQKIRTWKMTELKKNRTENGKKGTYWKVEQNAHLEIDKMDNAPC